MLYEILLTLVWAIVLHLPAPMRDSNTKEYNGDIFYQREKKNIGLISGGKKYNN